MPAVGAGVGVVERRAAVEEVARPPVLPQPDAEHPVDHRDQGARAVDHRRVDHLAPAAGRPLEQRREDPDDQEHRAPAEVRPHVQRRHGLVRGTDRVQGAGQAEVVDVVPGPRRERAVLAPAGHAGVDQARVAGQHLVRPGPEPLQDAGPQALHEDVGAVQQAEQDLAAGRRLQVDGDARPAAVDRVVLRADQQRSAAGPVDPDHVRAQLGQQHAGVRGRAEPGEFHDADPGQRAGRRLHGGDPRRRGGPVRRGTARISRVSMSQLSVEERAIVALVRDFVDSEVRPVVRELEHANTYPEALIEQMKELGVFGLAVPEPYGDAQVSTPCYALVTEELARGWMSLAGAMGGHTVVCKLLRDFGTRGAAGRATCRGWPPGSCAPPWRSPSPAAAPTCRPCAPTRARRRRRVRRQRLEDLDHQRPPGRADRPAVQDRPAAPTRAHRGIEHPARRERARV